LHRAVVIAAVALALPAAALADDTLNLDTGFTGIVGDITLNPGLSISRQGLDTLADLYSQHMTQTQFNVLISNPTWETTLAAYTYSATPIPASHVGLNEIFAVKTNAGNYALLEVTAAGSVSITVQYVTYSPAKTLVAHGTATLTAAAPVINAVMNNYSSVLPKAPNFGIPPGSLITIYGANMTEAGIPLVMQDPSRDLPKELNGSSVVVTVNGTTVRPALYYATPTQIAAVLPSSSPTGTGMVVVWCDGQASAPVPIRIVPSVFGFGSWSGAMAIVTDNATGKLITTSNSAQPGETVVFWGSGVGANTKNTDVGPPTNFDGLSGVTALYIGGHSMPIAYQGRSSYQGVDQIDVTLPANVPTGCAVSVAAMSGVGISTIVSNFVAIPIATNGGTCNDILSWVPPAMIPVLEQKPYLTFGQVTIDQVATPNPTGTGVVTADYASAIFRTISGPSFAGYQSVYLPTLGSCMVTQSASSTPTGPSFLGWLQAGDISVQGPNGTRPVPATTPGTYAANPLSGGYIPDSGGTFTFTGTAGPDVGAFSVAAVVPQTLPWKDSASPMSSIDRTQPLAITWLGSNATDIVQIVGTAALAGGGFSAEFVCDAVNTGSFTVPAAVLQAMPVGSGTLAVRSYMPPPQVFTATSLDFGFAVSYAESQNNVTYN
jgi:uncharacterized protein (TIGR03437 family)